MDSLHTLNKNKTNQGFDVDKEDEVLNSQLQSSKNSQIIKDSLNSNDSDKKIVVAAQEAIYKAKEQLESVRKLKSK